MYKSFNEFNKNFKLTVTPPAGLVRPYRCPKCNEWHEKTEHWRPCYPEPCSHFANLCEDCAAGEVY